MDVWKIDSDLFLVGLAVLAAAGAIWWVRRRSPPDAWQAVAIEDLAQVARPRALVADDSLTIQKVVELTFADSAWEVVAVRDGATAVAYLDAADFDLVITDLHMPGSTVTGYEVSRHSKTHDPKVPVIVLVGVFESFDEASFEASEADVFLKKPFDSQNLLAEAMRLAPAVHG